MDSGFFAGRTNYQNTINATEFQGLNSPQGQVLNGVQPTLNNASSVYARVVSDFIGGSQCFWSPTLAQWQIVQSAFNSGTTIFPPGTGEPGCYRIIQGIEPQIVIVNSVGQSTRGGIWAGAPAFLFTRSRNVNPLDGPVPPAVVRLP